MPAHYGGSISPRGHLSSRVGKNYTMRRQALVEKLVALDLAIANGNAIIPNADIARLLNMSVRQVEVIRRHVDYLRLRIERQTGIVTTGREKIADLIEYRKATFIENLPQAIRIVAETLQRVPTTPAERAMQQRMALEVLDREGTFLKASRTDVRVQVQHDYSAPDSVSVSILAALQGTAQAEDISSNMAKALEANLSFTNSEGMGRDEQEQALIELENYIPEEGEKFN